MTHEQHVSSNMVLLVDCHYLCWRAMHTTGKLSHAGVATGVLFGFFRDITMLRDRFNTDNIVFCFDSPNSLRAQSFPSYKSARRERIWTEQEIAMRAEMVKQIDNLRNSLLPELGFRNVFIADGYEADDVIAKISTGASEEAPAIVVTGDSDLYQLLGRHVMLFDPRSKKTTTRHTFKRQYGIHPDQWPLVKAMAGCSSDSVKGIKGVGDTTAIKYLLNKLPPKSAAYKTIKANQALIDINLLLVQLPFHGIGEFKLKRQDSLDVRQWNTVMDRYGIRVLQESRDRSQRGFFQE